MRAGASLVAIGMCTTLLVAGCGGGAGPTGRVDPTAMASESRSPSPGATSTAPSPTGTRPASTPSSVSPTSSPSTATTTPTTATCRVPTRFRGADVERLPVTDKVVALTFDAGANADGLPAIRRTLREKGVSATFFLTGDFVKKYPVRSARVGHEYLVGNHTLDHADLTSLSDRAVRWEVREAQSLILSATGQDPRRFFRFPYGARNAHAISLLNSLCYVPFRWTVDTLGWKGTSGGITARKVLDRVLAAAVPGAIVLMHVGSNPDDGTTLDADALPTVIDRLRARGYTFVRLSRVMSAAP